MKSILESMAPMQPMGPPTPPATLAQFPQPLQDIVMDAMAGVRCERATDIWYDNNGVITLLRAGVQWTLNPTAGKLWQMMDCTIGELVDACAADYPDADPGQIRVFISDFVIQAAAIGIVALSKSGGREPAAA